MNNLENRLARKLDERLKNGNLRTLKPKNNLKDFCSNDYLGIARNKIVWQKVTAELEHIQEYRLGATGSRLISGNDNYVMQLEEKLATLFDAEACLIFNSGYQANSALLAAIPQKGDTIISDELIHASLREGARLSFAQNFYFKHNNLEDLERKLQNATGEKFVVIETVYSMDGDFGDVENILSLCEKYEAYLIADEAHSTGIFGTNGDGYVCEKKLQNRLFARIYTFGKAIGAHGACIAGSKVLKDYLVNFARAFIYTTALPTHSLASVKCAFDYIAENPGEVKVLHNKIHLFKDALSNLQHPEICLKESFTPIQILKVGGNVRTRKFAQELNQEGFDVRPILSPTVREGEEILRICLHTFNSEEEILHLTDKIHQHIALL